MPVRSSRIVAVGHNVPIRQLLSRDEWKRMVSEVRDAVVFLIKNFPVIPVWVIGMLRAVEVIGGS